MCEFGKDFCEDDKICAVDQCLLMKLVLHTSDSIAQRKLMEVSDLDLPVAVRILDTYDLLQKTTNSLTENDFNQGCELEAFLIEFKFEFEFTKKLQV